jgi:hypothetical protein
VYTVQDAAGNSASAQRSVIVEQPPTARDTIAPAVRLDGENPMTIAAGQSYVEPGFSAVDNVDGDIGSRVTVSGDQVDPSVPGTYRIVYTVQDAAGNSASAQRSVIVEQPPTARDTIAPAVSLTGADTVTIQLGEPFEDPGATALDETDGSLAVTVNGTVDHATPGTYALQYVATDKAGNSASVQRTVIVAAASPGGLFDLYDVPGAAPLPSIDIRFTTIRTDGDAPDISAMREAALNWDLPNGEVYNLGINYHEEPYYKKPEYAHALDQTPPTLTITGSEAANIDGTYYAAPYENGLVLVSTDGAYALLFLP